jgi:hypothetical protein
VPTRSIVVDHLETTFKDDDKVAVLCIFCNYKEQTEQTVLNLVASLLRQLVQGSHANLEGVKSLYTRHKNNNTRPTLDELSKMLESEIALYSKIFIVLDALDECREEDATRAKLLKTLLSLPKHVHLMVTSRNISSITREFEGMDRIDIRGTDEDVRTYIEGRIALAPRHIQNLRETIAKTILGNVDGM